MDRLETIAEDIAQGYFRVYQKSTDRPPICLYNGLIMNGTFDTLGKLVHKRLFEQGISVSSLTLSREANPVQDHYNVDVLWFTQHCVIA